MSKAGEEIVPRDSHVVKTSQLCKHMDEWVRKHQSRFPRDLEIVFKKNECFRAYGALQYIADHMAGEFEYNYRKVERVRRNNTKYTELRIADEILTAMECSYLLGTEIKVYNEKTVVDHHPQTRKPQLA